MRLALLTFLCSVALSAQVTLPTGSAPGTTVVQDGPALTDLEACQVSVHVLNNELVRLKQELAEVQKAYDLVLLRADRVQRTPPDRDGFIWDWEQRKYVKPATTK